MPKIIMLAGAPKADLWQDADLTVDEPLPSFMLASNGGDEDVVLGRSHGIDSRPKATASFPAWRSLTLKEDSPAPELASRHWLPGASFMAAGAGNHADAEISFLTDTGSDPISTLPDDDATQFLEESLALHEDTDVSQLLPASTGQVSGVNHKPAAASALPDLPDLTSLAALPKAATLTRINPQTMTVDLIVGIIAAPPPKCVTIRKTGRTMELVELLLGDETKAGVSMTFWLPEVSSRRVNDRDDDERRRVLALRAGDVVCLRNVALREFKGVVHGQSLGRRGRGASATVVSKVDYSLEVSTSGVQGRAENRAAEKVERVREWTRKFVRTPGVGTSVGGRGKKRAFDRLMESTLPPDETQ